MRHRPALLAGIAASWLLGTAMAASAAAPAAAPVSQATPAPAAPTATTGGEETGLAAVYSSRLAGHKTASGKRYNPSKLTAAHKTLPFGTQVKVTNTKNGKSVVVTITDRGPKQAGRILDITPRAAHALGIGKYAMAEVKAEVVGK